jgi:predicted DNA-binding protein
MATSKPIAVRLPIELEARLKTLSEKTGRPMSYFIRKMIAIAIEELEDEVWAQEEVEEWLKSDQKSYPAEELRSKLRK